MSSTLLKMVGFVALFCGTTCYAKDEPVVVPASDCIHAAVRVNNPGASCGTIIGTKDTKLYVLSTGHMEKRTTPEVEIFYQSGEKLKKPLVLKGRTVFLVENGIDNGVDFSLIEVEVESHRNFSFIPLAPSSKKLKLDRKYVSIGCDLGIVPTVFKATPVEQRSSDFITEGDDVRAGRSGGGLFDKKRKLLIGVCWGGTIANGNRGMFTSHTEIVKLLKAAKYEFLIHEPVR